MSDRISDRMTDVGHVAETGVSQSLAASTQATEPTQSQHTSTSAQTERAALAWYAETMAGAPIQAEDLEAVVDLTLPVARAVQRAALRDLQWTDVTQSLGPQLRQLAAADESTP